MRAFRTTTTVPERDPETGEELSKTLPILAVQFNTLKPSGSYLMPNEQVADALAMIITQFGNQPQELLRFGTILTAAAVHSNGEREAFVR